MADSNSPLINSNSPRENLVAIRAEMARRQAQWQQREVEERSAEIRAQCTTLLGFVKQAWHVLEPSQPYIEGLPIQAMSEHLEAVHFGYITRLLTNVPPGTMKSLLHGVFFPAWEWGPQAKPSTRYIGTAHNIELASRDSLKFKKLVESDWFQGLWGDRVMRSTPWSETEITNTATGFRKATAFTAITGERANRVIVDDPLSVNDADSQTVRKKVLRLFREAVPTRLNDRTKDAIMVVMQRLHDDDPSGYILRNLRDQYTCLVLPMEYDPARKCQTILGPKRWEDPRTKEGELLFPERFPRDLVELDKITMGAYASAGQLQQLPTPREGGLFKTAWTDKRVKALPANCQFVRAWDFASTEKKQGLDPDATANALMAKTDEGHFIICKVEEDFVNAAAVESWLKRQAEADGYHVRIRIPQDPAQAGKYQAMAFGRALAGYMLSAVSPTGDKERRAQPLASQFMLGNVSLLETGDPAQDAWIEPFLEQLHLFPAGSHDDMVDAVADAFLELAGNVMGMGYYEFIKRQAALAGQAHEKKEAAAVPMVTLKPPQPFSVIYGIDGQTYRPDSRGYFIVPEAEAAGHLRNGWVIV